MDLRIIFFLTFMYNKFPPTDKLSQNPAPKTFVYFSFSSLPLLGLKCLLIFLQTFHKKYSIFFALLYFLQRIFLDIDLLYKKFSMYFTGKKVWWIFKVCKKEHLLNNIIFCSIIAVHYTVKNLLENLFWLRKFFQVNWISSGFFG